MTNARRFGFTDSTFFFVALALCIFYAVGAAANLSGRFPNLMKLTPLTLLLSAAALWSQHRGSLQHLFVPLVLAAAAGFIVELIGVNTGLIFGKYQYGVTLGPKIWHTPWLIGLNWAMFTYAAVMWLRPVFARARHLIPLIGAAVLVLIDIPMEPVAVKTGMWHWFDKPVPIQNYLAWYIVAAAIIFALDKILPKNATNRLAGLFLLVQFLFFVTLAIFW